MRVWDAEGTGEIAFEAAELDAPVLGHIVENSRLTAALLGGIRERRDLALHAPARLADVATEPGSIRVTLEQGGSVTARLLVAADGALSRVRELARFRTREWDYGHHALVTTVETEKPHGGTAYQRFLGTGPLAYLPLPEAGGRHYCSIVWSAEPELAESLLEQSETDFCGALAAALEHRLGDVLACASRTAFPLRQRHAVDYIQPRIALVGDAAHTIHPLAGQGINLGLQDVLTLAEELAAGARRGEDAGEVALLRRYQRRRKSENLLMMAAMDGFKHLFGDRRLPVRWLRNQGLNWVDRSGPLKQQLMRHAMGVR
jgi:2-octaprenylphenol hydroxylase